MHGELPWPSIADMTAQQAELYAQITKGKRAAKPSPFRLTADGGRLEGPFNAMLLNPAAGSALQRLGESVRFATNLTDREREIAILEVARNRNCEFEWYAHERCGREIGLTNGELRSLRDAENIETLSENEQAVRQLSAALSINTSVDEEKLQDAKTKLASDVIMDVIVLVGYYGILSMSLRIWKTPLPVSEPLSLLD